MTLYGLTVRLIGKHDAKFIAGLRNDLELSQYLSKISTDINDQILWIEKYKIREGLGQEYYFVYEYNDVPIGLNRMKNIRGDSWMGASLVFSKFAPPGSAIIGSMIHYYIGFEILGLSVHFGDVLKDNIAAIRFNRYFNVDFIHEDDKYHFMILTKNKYLDIRKKFKLKLQ